MNVTGSVGSRLTALISLISHSHCHIVASSPLHLVIKLNAVYLCTFVVGRALEFPRREFPPLKSVEFQLEFPARKWPFRGNSLEFPYRGGHCNYRGYFFRASPEGRTGVSSYTGEGRHLGVLFCDVTLKIFGVSGASYSAVQSPCALALPVPDVHMQLANSKPVLDERGCKEHR